MSIFEEIIFSSSVALKKKRYLCKERREKSPAFKKAFLLYPKIEIANFTWKDRDNVTLILYLYMYLVCFVIPIHKHTAWEYCFFTHFHKAFGDARFW